jgi:hypothetical protein
MAPDGAFSGYARESDKTADIVEARVSGDDMVFTTPWSHGSIGKYFGRFGLDNRLTGFCYDITNPSSQATWVVTDREFPKP